MAFLKSHLTPPNTAVKSAPVKFSPSNFTSWPANVAQYEFFPFLFSFNFFISLLTFPPKVSLNIIDKPITTKITGKANFHIKSKSKIFWHPKSNPTPINNPITFPVFSLSLNKPIKQGMMILDVALG